MSEESADGIGAEMPNAKPAIPSARSQKKEPGERSIVHPDTSERQREATDHRL